uniref:NADH-ubiquinone oxidoreductase chain 6 n=1 Tax=Synchytrium endobioticum TaxID=286115 RepID=A0A4P8NU17_9FUNG|nr:NADH dehydrogenase subunit 6 [Synchytrium endobioticum]QCQ68433.1 NADH dehydrogenase subunit 6 [Synchytrium endobioticum]QCQ68452.1 NADH dehydrogenase subunit 6 [Synchytrium endobioticum]QCQ68471.1 NADH dehydrogenase subunit 6 [Synchytrium endobioticum]QCQ68490.1 NADH dehydrogenase subunit 6 [Synchytrium endobioticum]QCQ68509.1 NADH dehydrogenase subunit 6 [Synchytrium endobioticum]
MALICYYYNFLVLAILISNLVVLSALNPIHRMVWLIIVFVLGSFVFLLLDFIFIGLTYIIVYVGAIAILFLFVIMMVQIHNGSETSIKYPGSLRSAPQAGGSLAGTNFFPLNLNLGPRPLVIENASTDTTFKFNLRPTEHNRTANPGIWLKSLHSGHSAPISKGSTDTNTFNLSTLAFAGFPAFLICLILVLGASYFLISTTNSFAIGTGCYFSTSWFELLTSCSDIETLANMIYIAYPTALVFIAILLWSVLIGVIQITMAASRGH